MPESATTSLRIALDKIHPSKSNPRKTFDDQALAELAASIAQHGVTVPIKVRPHPTKNHGSYELVFGERRWRASQLAKVTDIPAIVEDLDDTAVLEQQIIENTQRVDVHPLEEAESYQQLIEKHGYTMERLIERTGRSRSHLYLRMQLLKLSPAVKKALASNKISLAIAKLAATIPIAKVQEQYLEDVLGAWKEGNNKAWDKRDALGEVGIHHENVANDAEHTYADDFAPERVQPLSYRAAQALLHRKYSTRLALAKFDPADASLYPEAGACTSCPHRSGNQPELFPDLSKPEDVCTNPPCFQKKTETRWKECKLEAKHRGVEVVEGDDAKKVFNYDGSTTQNAPYADPSAELPYNLQKSPGAKATWSKLLGKKLDEVPKVLVQDPSGAPRELIDQKKAVEVLRELGKIDAPAKHKSGSSDAETKKHKEQQKKEKAKDELNEQALQRALEMVAEKAAADLSGQKELALLRWIGEATFRDYAESGGDGGDAMLKRRNLETYDDLAKLAENAKNVGEARALLAEFYVSMYSSAKINGWLGQEGQKKFFGEGLKLLGVDWDKALAAAKEAAKIEAKADAAKDAKKVPPAKKGKKP